jgi:hypothetical protein
MFTLNDQYSDLNAFFVNNLGVRKMTAKMVYDKLKAPDGPELSVNEAKETLMAFNSFLTTKGGEFDPGPILENKVFPVRFPNGEIKLQKGTQGFALLDRKLLGDDFAGRAKFLHFGMDEIRTLQPFIKWAGLESRYLSKAVKEISSADGDSTRPISSLNRNIRQKAHALLRYVVLRHALTSDEADSHSELL